MAAARRRPDAPAPPEAERILTDDEWEATHCQEDWRRDLH
jgi:hypothetical protein